MEISDVDRKLFSKNIKAKFKTFPVVALLGARQSGKTTLARMYCREKPGFSDKTNYFDLENPADQARLSNPKLALQDLTGLVVIDEIQRAPDLFPVLRYLIDRPGSSAEYLILGSASRDLIGQSSESLAGRIGFIDITPFSLEEVGAKKQRIHWLRGGFPRSFLAKNDSQSFDWLEEYVRTYLERDIPALGIQIPARTMRRFWTMLSHVHGSILNLSELGRSFGVADTTIRRYLDILSGTFMTRQLQPYHANLNKRQVKTPKFYFRDTGILHYFLGIRSYSDLITNPKLGASWEGYALEETIRLHSAHEEDCSFWKVHQQDELDLLILKDGKRFAYEFKYTDRPAVSRSMLSAMELLALDRLEIVSPVDTPYQIHENIYVRPIHSG